jgi:hypothetical protein
VCRITRTFSSRVRSADRVPRATLVPLPPWRGSVKLQNTVRSEANCGLSATSSRPPCPRESTSGTPAMGAPICPVAETILSCPVFSVTRKEPSGSGSTAHGRPMPRATTCTSYATLELTPQARVCPWKAGCWLGALAARVSSGVHCPGGLGWPGAPGMVSPAVAPAVSALGAQAATSTAKGTASTALV